MDQELSDSESLGRFQLRLFRSWDTLKILALIHGTTFFPTCRCYFYLSYTVNWPIARYIYSSNCPSPKFQSPAICLPGCQGNTFYSSTDSAGIWEFQRNPQELTGISMIPAELTGISGIPAEFPGIDWNLHVSRGTYYKRYNMTFGNHLYKGLTSFSKFFSYIFTN